MVNTVSRAEGPENSPSNNPHLDRTSVATQTYTHEPGSLESFTDSCEIHRRQLRCVITAHRSATDRSRRPTPAHHPANLLCPCCKEIYDPKVKPALALPCGHSLCRACMQKAPRSRNLTCPLDFRSHPIPTTGFPPDYLLMELVEKARTDPDYLCADHQVPVVGFCTQDSQLICGDCVFSHREHVCFDFHSVAYDRFVGEIQSELTQAHGDLRESQEAWMTAVTMFEMYYLQFSCSALASYVGCKDMMALTTGMPVSYERPEAAFKQICAQLEDIRKQHYELLEVGRKRVADLDALCKEFSSLSSPEKVTLSTAIPRDKVDFEQFVRDFSMALTQANCYAAPNYMPMQGAQMY